MLALAFAKALSELPAEKVHHCWAPLQSAYDNMDALHSKVSALNEPMCPHPLSLACGAPHGTQATQELGRLFPNMQAHIPDGNEEEPTSDAEDDFSEELTAEREGAEHGRAADAAGQLGVPASRPPRAAAIAANVAMDALDQRGELV